MLEFQDVLANDAKEEETNPQITLHLPEGKNSQFQFNKAGSNLLNSEKLFNIVLSSILVQNKEVPVLILVAPSDEFDKTTSQLSNFNIKSKTLNVQNKKLVTTILDKFMYSEQDKLVLSLVEDSNMLQFLNLKFSVNTLTAYMMIPDLEEFPYKSIEEFSAMYEIAEKGSKDSNVSITETVDSTSNDELLEQLAEENENINEQ